MRKKQNPTDSTDAFDLPITRSSDLRGKQSVRATFKLTENAINVITTVAVHLGIKQKSLFDHLIEDAETLELIAREIQPRIRMEEDRIQKTFVLSRNTLSLLEKVCSRVEASRDAIVEYSIQRLLPVIAAEREKHRKRKSILEELRAFTESGQKLRRKVYEQLGEDDPFFQEIEKAVSATSTAYEKIEQFVKKGEIIEQFETD